MFKIVLATIFLSGCVTTYTGPTPDLEKRGAAADTEYRHFKLYDGFFQGDYLAMGADGYEKMYFKSSLEPTITKVSPEAWKAMDGAKIWNRTAWVFLGVALGILLSAGFDGDGKYFSKDQSLAYWSSIGLSVTSSFVRNYKISEAAELYNKELRQKLTPSVSLNYSFE